MRKIFYVLLGVVALLAIALGIAALVLRAPKPTGGESGAAADELAHRLERDANLAAWNSTGAITWTHAGRNNHLWDRARNFDRVRFKDGVEVLLDIARRDGIATKNGAELIGEEKSKALQRAYRWWTNDSFWLNPLSKLFDEGVTRQKIANLEGEPGSTGLLISYASGGVTPGDAYLWIVPEKGLPVAWRMWVSIIPVGGLRVKWEGWKAVETGAMIATQHGMPGLSFELADLKAAPTLLELTGGSDPFAALGGTKTSTVPPGQGPSSQPSR